MGKIDTEKVERVAKAMYDGEAARVGRMLSWNDLHEEVKNKWWRDRAEDAIQEIEL